MANTLKQTTGINSFSSTIEYTEKGAYGMHNHLYNIATDGIFLAGAALPLGALLYKEQITNFLSNVFR